MSTTETTQEKLIRLTNQRVPKILQGMIGVARLASYDPTPEQARKIIAALRTQLEAVEAALQGKKATEVPKAIL